MIGLQIFFGGIATSAAVVVVTRKAGWKRFNWSISLTCLCLPTAVFVAFIVKLVVQPIATRLFVSMLLKS